MSDDLIEPSNPDLWASPQTVQDYIDGLQDALTAAQARIAELEAALRDIATPKVGPDFDWSDDEVTKWRAGRWKWAQDTAREALKPKGGE